MAYEVTATRKRPQIFDTLAGQEFVVSTLRNAIQTGHIAHAYLFSGPRGVGKTSAARILAKSLNCTEGPTPTPCGRCSSCQEIQKGSALDVIEIDGASNTSVNDIREIKDEVLFAPNSCRYKVYIIDEVHMLSNSAFNALLKTIEEPPPYIIFIFATTEIHKVPATIRSRCQQFNFRLVDTTVLRDLLAADCRDCGIKAEEEALLWIAKEATGSVRDAYTLYDQVVSFSNKDITLEKIREKLGLVGLDRINLLADYMAQGRTAELLEETQKILAAGVSIEQFIVDLTEYFRSILFIKNGIQSENILGSKASRFSQKVQAAFTDVQAETSVELLLNLFRDIRYSLNPRFELELVLSRLCRMPRYLTRQELIDEIHDLKEELSSGNFEIRTPGSSSERSQDSPSLPQQEAPPSESQEAGSPPTASSVPSFEESPEAPEMNQNFASVPAEAAPVSGLSYKEAEALWIRDIRKEKPTLASAVESAEIKIFEEGTLTMQFGNPFSRSMVLEEIPYVAKLLSQIMNQQVMVKAAILDTKKPETPETRQNHTQVETVRKVFKGEILSGG